jgi:hypothetical protein
MRLLVIVVFLYQISAIDCHFLVWLVETCVGKEALLRWWFGWDVD